MNYNKARELVTEALVRVNRQRNPYFNDLPRDPISPIYNVRPTPPDVIPPFKPKPPTARPPLGPNDLNPPRPSPSLPTSIPPGLYRPGIYNNSPFNPFAHPDNETFNNPNLPNDPSLFTDPLSMMKSKATSKSTKASSGKTKMAGKGTASPSQAYAGAAKSLTFGGKTPTLDAPGGLGEEVSVAGRDRRLHSFSESHNIETLKDIPTSRLRKLHAKYKAKGTKEASREAATIGRILSSRVNEAISTNDPNRGRMGRKKPLVPQGMMPDDTRNPRTGNPVRTLGKLHSRLDKLSPETRTKYRQNYGYRTRVAGRGRRLYPSP